MKKIFLIAISIIIILFNSSLIEATEIGIYKDNNIKIGIIDTGISSTSISNKNLLEGKNYILPYGSTEDGIGHGTAVAGIIVGNEDKGIKGLAPDVQLVPLVYYSKYEDNISIKGNINTLAQAIEDAINIYDCDIINISSGARIDTIALRDAIALAEENGVVVISSAGNDGNNNPYYPGVFETVICVGSTNETNDGVAIFSNKYNGVNLLAPGIKLKTLGINGELINATGTSFSTAYVTGIVANILTKYPDLTPYEIRKILYNTTTDIYEKLYDINSGWGIIDYDKAMDYIENQFNKSLLFNDIKENAHYKDAVIWAVKKGITSGTTAKTFSPDMTCTRAQVVTFLWRTMGSPEPRIINNPFEDIKKEDYFYKAVLWAIEKGITSGTSKSTFSPTNTCTDAEVITFIWRAKNQPNPNGKSIIASKLGEYYYTDAVAWADTNGVLEFNPFGFNVNAQVSRSTIISYLFNSNK